MKVLTKRKLADQLANEKRLKMTKTLALDVVETVLDLIACHFINGGELMVVMGFGTFKLSRRRTYENINPTTGKKMVVPAMNTVAFRAAKELKRNLNMKEI